MNDVWVSAYFPHPLRLNHVVHASWREERQGGAGASPPPGFLPVTTIGPDGAAPTASAAAETGSRRWGSSSDEDEYHSSKRVPAPWISTSSPPPPHPDVRVPATHLSDCHLGSSRLQPRTPAAHSLVFVRWNSRFSSALTTPSCACAMTTKTGSTAGTAGCLARMACVPLWSLTFTLLTSRLRSSSRSRPHRTHRKAFGADQHSRRPTDKLQILCWNPGHSGGGRLRDRQFSRGELPHRQPALLRVLLNKDTFHTGILVCTVAGSVHAHLRLRGGRRYGGYWQVPQGSRRRVLVFHHRQHPH